MIAQGMAIYQDNNLLNDKTYYHFAIACACIGFGLGFFECLRVLGKTIILDEAEKIRIAMYTFGQINDPRIKEMVQKIGEQMRGRPDKHSIGELEFLSTRLDSGIELAHVLSDYSDLLSKKVHQETLRNPIINAWRNKSSLSEKTSLINYS
eukprot:TRINITY_DN4199_c0_g1_i2.p1 TRINITY_DN4199_c0_g1~~TRINITY_DN4199_c0_g1_i2.p1  ORF type:complete len:151 (+),score=16.36 TRINITY_DN4199_c0_g1_i2:300-752(+)